MARRLLAGFLVILTLTLGWGTTPWVETHAHSSAGLHGHAHAAPHAYAHAHDAVQSTGRESEPLNHPHRDAADLGAGNPGELVTDDSESSWHQHAGILLPGAALVPIEWFLALGVCATAARFPALPSVARTTCALEAPLRPPRQPS